MAKKAAAGRSKAKKTMKKAAGAATQPAKVRVSFERLHAEIDAALAQLEARAKGSQREALIAKLKTMRSVSLCPSHSMFVEMA